MRRTLALALVFTLVACGKPTAQQQAQATADALTGDAAGDAANNPLCKMFTPAELAEYAGAPVSAGQNAAMGSGCQWPGAAGDGAGSVLIQIVNAKDHTPISGAAGFKSLPDIGVRGFIAPQMGGWQAGAIQGPKSINITTGSASSEAKTEALLRETLKRAS